MISVIIVSWRAKEKLKACLDSLQLYGGDAITEIIVVDNASNDGTVEMLKKLYPFVVLIENEKNLGFSKANNQGLALARGEYILFLNPDTEITRNSLQILLKGFEDNDQIVAVGPKLINPDGKIWIVCARRLPTLWTEFCSLFLLDRIFPKSILFAWKYYGDWKREDEKQVECLVGAAILARNDILTSIRGFDESVPLFLDDMDLCKKLGMYGKIYYCPEAVIYHHHNVSGSQQSSTLLQQMSFQAHYVYFKKWKNILYAWLYASAVLLAGIVWLLLGGLLYFPIRGNGKKLLRRSGSSLKWFFSTSKDYEVLPN